MLFFYSPSFPADILNSNEEMCCGKACRPSGLPCTSPEKCARKSGRQTIRIFKGRKHQFILKIETHNDLFFVKKFTVKIYAWVYKYHIMYLTHAHLSVYVYKQYKNRFWILSFICLCFLSYPCWSAIKSYRKKCNEALKICPFSTLGNSERLKRKYFTTIYSANIIICICASTWYIY